MKFTIEIDLTPQEFRESLGLPDIAGLQNDLLESVRKKMEQGVEDFDPVSLVRGWLSQGLVGVGELQRMFMKYATEPSRDRSDSSGSGKTRTKKASRRSGAK